jgi:hypothetical protein
VLWLRAEREMEGREATDPSLKRRDFAHVRRTLLFLFLFAPVFFLPSICSVSSSLCVRTLWRKTNQESLQRNFRVDEAQTYTQISDTFASRRVVSSQC